VDDYALVITISMITRYRVSLTVIRVRDLQDSMHI